LSWEEAKPKLLEKLTKEKVDSGATDKANEVRAKIQEALAAKKPFEEAIAETGVTVKEVVWTANKPVKDAPNYLTSVQSVARSMNAGELAAEAIPTTDAYILVYVAKKELPWDPVKGPEDKALLSKQLTTGASPFSPSTLFIDWFKQRRDEASPILTSAK